MDGIILNSFTKKEIPFGRPWIDEADKKSVMEVLDGHILTHGPKCIEFENKFRSFMKSGYAVTTSSCMASLHLASIYFNFQAGDEIIVPAQTHVATVHAIELVGAKPIFLDCDINTGNIDIHRIEEKISNKTKAISLVHFSGIPVEMDKVCEIAKKFNLLIIEDCALALGSFYKGKHVGLWGDVGCFSFYPAKHITTAEGGMLVSSSENIVKNIASFRAFNVDHEHSNRSVPGIYDVIGVGLNYRMSELQAALGCAQMDKIAVNLQRRSNNFSILKRALSSVTGISHVLDSQNFEGINSYYCLIAILDGRIIAQRNKILQLLKSGNIGCSVYYPQPVPRMKYYAEKYQCDLSEYPNASMISDGSIALPVGPHLQETDMLIVADSLNKVIGTLL
ncbi:MAG TPA: DegT/DnrJ/EryC1/StrS aminotransferase family protein [Gammaproteobacteria bacterium]|nr:DegT/DnrJ/EryC1/StrS aminotransferase family protein [Gammaproteobacteria bacterium]